jgi:ribonuclease BN (tRNA processing enzyme)
MSYKFLGTGGAFDYQFGSASMMIDMPARILVDCGPSIYPKLMDEGLLETIDYLLLTHLHGDHVGSIFQFLHERKKRGQPKLKIITPNQKFGSEVKNFLNSINTDPSLYEIDSLNMVPGIEAIDTTNKHGEGVTSFAYIFRLEKEVVYYSGDLGDISVTLKAIELENPQTLTIFHDTCFNKNRTHTYYKDLEVLLEDYNVYGYHLNPQDAPSDNLIPLVNDNSDFLF